MESKLLRTIHSCQKESEREATHIYTCEVPALRILKSNSTTQHTENQNLLNKLSLNFY